MTPIEFREKKTRDKSSLKNYRLRPDFPQEARRPPIDGTGFSPENKDRLFRTYERQLERLTVVVSSPSLERLCSAEGEEK